MSEGFMGRWSRRKQEVRAGKPTLEEAPRSAVPRAAVAQDAKPLPASLVEPEAQAEAEARAEARAEAEEAPALTLADVQALGADADFKPFVAREVAPEVRNAAFRKLFSDPHFNVMDGLDTYVDDYSKPTPLPDAVLRQMASAKFLKLFDEEPETAPADPPRAVWEEDVAQSRHSRDIPSPPVADAQPASQETDDHHADLRLQPDDAPRGEEPRDGAG
jgi:hypothetical protein